MSTTAAPGALATPQQNVAHWRSLHEGGHFASHPYYRERLHDLGVDMIAGRLDLRAQHTLLEVGCGYGRLLWHVLPRVRRAIGVDLHGAPLREASDLLRGRGEAALVLGNGLDLSCVASGAVDRAVAFTVLQHMTRPGVETYLREMSRVLAPGGLALVNFPDDGVRATEMEDRAGEQSIRSSPAQILAMAQRAGVHALALDRVCLEHLYPGRGLVWWWLRFR